MKPTNNYSYEALGKSIKDVITTNEIFVYLLAGFLIVIPLGYALGSIIGGLLVFSALLSARRNGMTIRKPLLLPMFFYALMLLSLFWTRDTELTLSGLRKEMFFFLLPFAFLFIPDFSTVQVNKVMRLYSWGMLLVGASYIIKAAYRFISTGKTSVFFYHELVSLDVNAIYVAVFMSLAFFYFFSIRERNALQNAALAILAVIIVLLSSKSVIFIDFILVCCFYMYFANVRSSVKWLTVASATVFVAVSIAFIPKVRDRFLIEYETAFVDNTPNRENESVVNISLKQAWNLDTFGGYNYFPGGALRVYQIRVFTEIMEENPSRILSGFGLEASQHKIKEKEVEHQLHTGYGDYNFHNQYIQTFAELGVIGFLLVITMIVVNLRKAFANKNFLHIVFAITMLVLFLSESFFCRQRGIIFFVALYCFFNAVKPAAPEEAK